MIFFIFIIAVYIFESNYLLWESDGILHMYISLLRCLIVITANLHSNFEKFMFFDTRNLFSMRNNIYKYFATFDQSISLLNLLQNKQFR